MKKRIVFTTDFKRTPTKQQVATLLASDDQRVECGPFVKASAQCIDAQIHVHECPQEIMCIGFLKLHLIWAGCIQLFCVRAEKVPI
ncbi:hypothetical protein WT22_27185 [Burkholderia territorii]|nr:hypothetical protein WT22_27185 [Burkholderia territorii]KWA41812.1 hypothetical protein WT40_03555 [Burkholderia territorii]